MIRKKTRILKAALAGLLACAMLPVTGCHKAPSSNEKTYNIAVIVKNTSSAYWDAIWKACDDAEAELGSQINIIRMGPPEENTDLQIEEINKAISQKADAIVLAACDPEAENEALASATAAGIPILTIDSDVTYEGRTSYIGTMNKNAGETAARRAADLLNNEGTIGVIYHGSASTATERREAFQNLLSGDMEAPPEFAAGAGSKQNNSLPQETDEEGNPLSEEAQATETPAAYSGMKIAEALNGESKWDVSKEQAVKLITEDNVDLIFATNSKGTWGACEAVAELVEAGTIKQGEVYVIGFDYFENDGKSADMYLSKGILDTTLVQNPYNMGYLGIRYALDIAKGTPIPSLVDTGVVQVTADNINDSDVQFLITN